MSGRIRVSPKAVLGALAVFGTVAAAPAAVADNFLNTMDLSGTLASSYFYNTNDPNNNDNTYGGSANPFHPNSNQFQFDELWISASREGEAISFGFDVVFGALGDINGGGGGGNGVWVSQAYVDWATPLGVTLTVGKFGTHIGYEVAGAAFNSTVTRGFAYQSFQPVSQLGAKLSGSIGVVDWMVGGTNGLGENQPDNLADGPDVIWSLGTGGETTGGLNWGLNFAGEYGGDGEFFGGAGGDDALVLDGIISLSTDVIESWVNFTWAKVFEGGSRNSDPDGWALNVGTRAALSDVAGITGRIEYGQGEGSSSGPASVFGVAGAGDFEAIAVTGVLDYMLVKNLQLKFEVKWDHALDADGSTDVFQDGDATELDDQQVTLGAQLVFTF